MLTSMPNRLVSKRHPSVLATDDSGNPILWASIGLLHVVVSLARR